ncbi:hypothetical protein CFD26_106916 [Aspergillus turcosus]|uniref:NAD-dependent epimerase/dehydratase domain-containing protein n=1 Tax=Aspergillus turcosus TaxID=1245748 RepID=A0A3R7IMG7_9EURO|nr:hypothetical protein CFD26_106916 [Aspergillus turcosus]
MAPRVFVTGAAGYIGGTTVGALLKAHPDYEVVALVRDQTQSATIKKAWPNVETVIGTLDDDEILAKEGSKADVVLHLASSDHLASPKSIMTGMATGKKGRFIHISGTGVLNDASTGFGNVAPKVYDDIKDVQEIINLPMTALHRDVDNAVITCGKEYGVPTAILCPPMIHGVGTGPGKKRSIQVPFLIEAIVQRGRAFTVGEGNNRWDHVHVEDLARAFVLMVEEATKPNGGAATWGPEGYYFVEAGEFAWKEVASQLAEILHSQGKITTSDVDQLPVDEATKFHPWAPVLWGGNCRSRASRLRTLGWKPTVTTVSASLPEMVKFVLA